VKKRGSKNGGKFFSLKVQIEKWGEVKNKGGKFCSGVVCPLKKAESNRGKVLIYNLIKTPPPLFFTGHSCAKI